MASSLSEQVTLPHISIHPDPSGHHLQHHLIFFITGNPGLINYYDTFLSTLHSRLSSSTTQSNAFHIYGQSLAGFSNDLKSRQTPFTLEEQITHILSALKSQRHDSKPYTSIILIGHSVGAYILLELISRLRKESSASTNIQGGILLFPTITNIAGSPSGVKLTALLRIPNFPWVAGRLAENLCWLIPRSSLKWLVGLITRMPPNSAEVTTEFLKNDRAIHQALFLAKDEILTITEDKWDEDIWGIEHPEANKRIPKLVFYFGKKDHWVADHTRDALIAARGRGKREEKSSKPLMLIDEGGIEHGFCIHHSESVAEKCSVWIEDMTSEEKEACDSVS